MFESLRGEVEAMSETGRAARDVACRERSFSECNKTEEAAVNLFRRVHAK